MYPLVYRVGAVDTRHQLQGRPKRLCIGSKGTAKGLTDTASSESLYYYIIYNK